TVERAHALEDGGGRELAYVKMSRAKERSTVYVVADSMAQAKDDLRCEWGTDRRLGWVIDAGVPVHALSVELRSAIRKQLRETMRPARLRAEREAILAVIPHDPAIDIRLVDRDLARLACEREDLAKGEGRYRDHPVARAHRELAYAQGNRSRLEAL